MATPVFYYDFNSPYAYLAASRIDALIPEAVEWRPVAFAFVLRAHNRTPWSMHDDTRGPGMRECEERAASYGLPTLRWPPGWPVESYSLLPLRAAYVAAAHGRLEEFSAAAFALNFVDGAGLRDLADVLIAAERAGLSETAVREGIDSTVVKDELKAATEGALRRGVVGVPTVAVGDELFWGDDQLPAAAAASARSR
jgi:2-hydroxychromene-2-carboxylate isomerase